MEIDPNIKTLDYADDEISFTELFQAIWNDKWLILTSTSLFSIVAILYSLSLPNIYESNAYLSPVGESSSSVSSMQGMGGLASLAGINLPSQSVGSKSDKALKKLNTLSFFKENILPNIFLPDLIALESWDASTNTILYNKEVFNSETQSWVVESQVYSAQKSFRAFNERLRVVRDELTGFVTITIKHQSPFVAKEWAELVVSQLNTFYRSKDKLEAQTAINFLNTQIAQTRFTEIKQVLAQLLQGKVQKLTLIEVNNFYVFEYIDPPAVMEKRIEPSRSTISILGALMGGILGILITLIRFITSKPKTTII
jgi:LPS O-antigen subunit length determinant protein (WzzB/FepE family)